MVCRALRDRVADAVADRLGVTVVTVGERRERDAVDAVPVAVTLAPLAVVVNEADMEVVSVAGRLHDAVPVPVGVPEALLERVRTRLAVEAVRDSGEAVRVKVRDRVWVPVGRFVAVSDRVRVLGVGDGAVADTVRSRVQERVAVTVAVGRLLSVAVGLTEPEAVWVTVGIALCDRLRDTVFDGDVLPEGLMDTDPVGLAVRVCRGLRVKECELLRVRVSV